MCLKIKCYLRNTTLVDNLCQKQLQCERQISLPNAINIKLDRIDDFFYYYDVVYATNVGYQQKKINLRYCYKI